MAGGGSYSQNGVRSNGAVGRRASGKRKGKLNNPTNTPPNLEKP
jgi:hypothetical protein